MNFFSSSTLKPLRKDLHALADDATKLAHTQLMDPAMKALRQTRSAMMDRATQAERSMAQQCDRLANQITASPFTAVAIAFAAGWLIASLCGLGSSRNA
jgi:ElaB/YqjD/DUF883 family membrane-anchored ribosome-binding protein